MRLKSFLLVALSLLLPVRVPADDKHKRASRPSKVRQFIARAYCSGRVTSLGRKAVAGHTVAADPQVLPLDSHVLITNAGNYSGEYHVTDVGPGIRGQLVDIYVKNRREALEFGRRAIHVTVLHKANEAMCSLCNKERANGIISLDAAAGISRSTTDRAVPAGETGSSSRSGNSWQGGSLALVFGLPFIKRSPAH